MDKHITNPEELINFINNNNIKNLLLGNGYGLSHPDLKTIFKWDSLENLHEYNCKDLGKLFKHNKQDCPETLFLKEIRLYTLRVIIVSANEFSGA